MKISTLNWYEAEAWKIAKKCKRAVFKKGSSCWFPPIIYARNGDKMRIVIMTFWYEKAGLKHAASLEKLNHWGIE